MSNKNLQKASLKPLRVRRISSSVDYVVQHSEEGIHSGVWFDELEYPTPGEAVAKKKLWQLEERKNKDGYKFRVIKRTVTEDTVA